MDKVNSYQSGVTVVTKKKKIIGRPSNLFLDGQGDSWKAYGAVARSQSPREAPQGYLERNLRSWTTPEQLGRTREILFYGYC